MKMLISQRSLGAIFAILLLMAGCNSGRKLFPISGVVTIDGKPLKQGTVTVLVKDYRAAFGKIDKDGRYSLMTFREGDGCVAGEHVVTIVSQVSHGEAYAEYFAPISYSQTGESNLKIKVDQARENVNFDLTWKVDPQHKGPFILK